jgi:hypothetical protein
MATDISMNISSSATWTVTVKTSSGGVQDITSALMRMTAQRLWSSSNVFQKTVGAGITLTTPASGIATIVVPPSDLSTLSNVPTPLHYDVQVKLSGAADYVTVVEGTLLVKPSSA